MRHIVTAAAKMVASSGAKMVASSGSGLLAFYFDLPCDDSKQDWHLTGTSFLKVSEFAKKLNPELTGG